MGGVLHRRVGAGGAEPWEPLEPLPSSSAQGLRVRMEMRGILQFRECDGVRKEKKQTQPLG